MEAKHVYEAITAVTAAMSREGIAKGRTNTQQNFKFRGIDDVYNALSSHLASAQLCILPRVVERSVTERPTKTGGVSTYVVLTVEFDFVSSKDGSSHTIRTMGEAMDTADKATNKAMSAAMKYACLMAFQIPTEADNDADFSHHEKAAPATLERQLQASVDMTEWEKLCRSRLLTAGSLGELQGSWFFIRDEAKKNGAPKSVIDRLTAVKDRAKAALQPASGTANGPA
jgi:hypothetical protein